MKAQYAKTLKADLMHRIPKGAEVKVGPKEGGNYTIWYQGRLGRLPAHYLEKQESRDEQLSMEGFDATFSVKKEKF